MAAKLPSERYAFAKCKYGLNCSTLLRRRCTLPNTYDEPFQWKYCDVVTADWMKRHGTIQKDGHSCGVIWMMILWFVVTEEKAPSLKDCQQLWTSEEDLKNFRFWVVYSILADGIWLPREIADVIGEKYDDIEVPSSEQWLKKLGRAVISKLPVVDGNASLPTHSKGCATTDVSDTDDDDDDVEVVDVVPPGGTKGSA